MALTLSNLKPAKGSQKSKKRVGRGNASGKGTYSSRGIKGQRSRSGGRGGLKIRGMKARLQKIPKLRGFKSPQAKAEEVNISLLDKHFQDGDKVNSKRLKKLGLVENKGRGIKLLANGETKKKFIVQDCKVSAAAKAKIEAAGGKVL